MSQADRQHRLGIVLIVFAAIAWSTAPFFTRLLHYDSWTILFWRGLFGGGSIALFLVITQGKRGGRAQRCVCLTYEGQVRCHVPSCRMRRNVIQPIQQVPVIFDIMSPKLIELPARCTRSMRIFKSRTGSDWHQNRAVASRVELAHARKNSRYQFR